MEDIGDNQIKITFGVPKPNPYDPFVSQSAPVLQKAQFADCMGAQMSACTDQNFAPIGTGPFMVRWICGADPNPDNGWLGRNVPRHCNPEYDALYETLTQTGGVEARAEIVKQMNDLLIESGALIPLVFRGSVFAHSNSLAGVDMNGWDSEMWNVQDWHRADM